MKEMRKIYSERKKYIMAEHIDNAREAQMAAFEYRCEGYYVTVERDYVQKVYYIWTRPRRKKSMGLLPGEKIRRIRPAKKKLKLVS